MKKLVFTLLLSVLATISWGQESQTEYNFLRLPVSAHAAALGGENITIIKDDPALMFSNPALAASVSDMTVGLNYMNYMKGANYMGASFTKAIKEKATIAGGIQYMNYGKMKEVDENNVQTGEFSASEIAIQGIFSYELARNLVGGITAKFITSYIGNYNSMAVGVDLGLNWYEPETEWSVSAVAKNLGGQVKAYEEDFGKMPFDLQLGVSKTFAALPVRLSLTLVDLTHYNYRFINHLNLGAEVLLSQNIWIGAGYNFRKAEEMKIGTGDDESAHGAGFSIGAGVNLERFRLNLAYGKYHASSNSIMVNLAYSF
ncbi:type IX secretion system protein PorQ [Prevotella corporis]|uniref:type IX secretion system protein PorQ n=1 Tax=Prevotella corporis TaxID=28128 RepID=UPI0027E54D8A|nr:type IX secretion system protein PorQ [Prevotella corporis]MDQ7736639.1 type IX secretion system protein PorQ [Prevotella corporis]